MRVSTLSEEGRDKVIIPSSAPHDTPGPQMCASLCQDSVLDGSQRVVDPDEVLLTVFIQDECVEVQLDSVARVSPQLPLQIHVGWIGGIWEAWRPDLPLFSHVDIKGFLHCKAG